MRLFQKRKKVFGACIDPQCQYCQYNVGVERIECSSATEDGSPCRRYAYDPLKREPKGDPKLREFSADDFSL